MNKAALDRWITGNYGQRIERPRCPEEPLTQEEAEYRAQFVVDCAQRALDDYVNNLSKHYACQLRSPLDPLPLVASELQVMEQLQEQLVNAHAWAAKVISFRK